MTQKDLKLIRQEYQVYLLERILVDLEDAIELKILTFKEFREQIVKL